MQKNRSLQCHEDRRNVPLHLASTKNVNQLTVIAQLPFKVSKFRARSSLVSLRLTSGVDASTTVLLVLVIRNFNASYTLDHCLPTVIRQKFYSFANLDSIMVSNLYKKFPGYQNLAEEKAKVANRSTGFQAPSCSSAQQPKINSLAFGVRAKLMVNKYAASNPYMACK